MKNDQICNHTTRDTYSTVRVPPGPWGLGGRLQLILGKLKNTSKTLLLSNGGNPFCWVMQRDVNRVSPADSMIDSNGGIEMVQSWQH